MCCASNTYHTGQRMNSSCNKNIYRARYLEKELKGSVQIRILSRSLIWIEGVLFHCFTFFYLTQFPSLRNFLQWRRSSPLIFNRNPRTWCTINIENCVKFWDDINQDENLKHGSMSNSLWKNQISNNRNVLHLWV